PSLRRALHVPQGGGDHDPPRDGSKLEIVLIVVSHYLAPRDVDFMFSELLTSARTRPFATSCVGIIRASAWRDDRDRSTGPEGTTGSGERRTYPPCAYPIPVFTPFTSLPKASAFGSPEVWSTRCFGITYSPR